MTPKNNANLSNKSDKEEYFVKVDLLSAIRSGCAKKLASILQHQTVNINQKNNEGKTALMMAIELGREDMATQLLSYYTLHKMPLDQTDDTGQTPLMMAVKYQDNFSLLEKILKYYTVSMNTRDKQGYTALMMAILWDCPKNVQLLMAYGVELDKNTIDLAVKFKRTVILEQLQQYEQASIQKMLPLLQSHQMAAFTHQPSAGASSNSYNPLLANTADPTRPCLPPWLVDLQ